MQSLVTQFNNNLVISLIKVSDELSADIESMQRLIRTHKADLEKFGAIEFKEEIVKAGNGSTKKKLYYLNEQQSYLFITFLKNTKVVREFKVRLIQEFFRMKQELNNKPTSHHQIAGYKSQLAQKEKQIQQLQARVMQLEDIDCIASTITRALQDAHEYRKIKQIIQGN